MLTAVGYVRVSREEQAEKDLSIPSQKARIIAYCQSQDWELADIYIDDGYSAKSLHRPALQQLMKDCGTGRFQAVIVAKLDRLSRNQKDVLYLLEDVFEPAGIGFKSVTQSFDTTTAFGKASIGMLAVFAQLERDQLIERVVDAKKEAARQGRFMGGPPAYGYKHNPAGKSLEIDEIQAEVVRFIYDQYLRGDKGYQAITDLLNQKKIPAPKSAEWNRVAVNKILTSPFYAGFVPYKEQLNKGRHQAIVSPEQWEQVQDLLGTRSKYSPAVHSGLVSGMVYCGECGARMRTKNVWQNHPVTSPKKVTRYYICYSQDASSPHMIKDSSCQCGYKQSQYVDQEVVSKLMKYSLGSRLLRQAAKELLENKSSTDNEKLLVQARKEYETAKKRIGRWYDAFEKGALSPDDLMERVKDLREHKLYLEQQIQSYEQQVESGQQRVHTVDEFISLLRSFKDLWPEATWDEQKTIVKNLVKGITVFRDNRLEITLFPD